MGEGKVILVKTGGNVPELVPVTALIFDGKNNTVTINQVVNIDGNETAVVPFELCFEFDVDTMNNVNALARNAVMMMSAATQLCNAALMRAEFVTDGDAGQLVMH